jgi:cytochrome c-type biogenesis protein
MSGGGSISIGLAFLAGLVSFLSPCVLPIVPGYVTFVTGMTLEELTARGTPAARRHAALHAALFVLGFSLIFVVLGATASAVGARLVHALPLMQRVGGAMILLFGLVLLGVVSSPALLRERRVQVARKPVGMLGSVVVGVAFGAAWTPCVGPVLASILLYAGMSESMWRGTMLLAVYALGLAIPFWLAAVGFNWYLAGARKITRWLRPLERATGALLVIVGLLLVSGRLALLSNLLAGFGQLLSLES